MVSQKVFITGGTGYIGRRLIPLLAGREHEVRALVRKGSENKLPGHCAFITGDPLDPKSFADKIAPATTFIQLRGTFSGRGTGGLPYCGRFIGFVNACLRHGTRRSVWDSSR